MTVTQTTTSSAGRAQLRREEGCVLRAYRDVTGTWTIGDGLTAASGVVTPRAGMVITQAEADRLFVLALARNYEPAVRKAMPGAAQHEFDSGVSFHWNTGAISSAGWVALWKQRQWTGVKTALLAWNKSKGRVLPGLIARREREFRLLRDAEYSSLGATVSAPGAYAVVSAPLTALEAQEARASLVRLGYDVGGDEDRITAAALRQFQRDHDLTADGILGRATLATIRRMQASRAAGGSSGAIAVAASVNAATPVGPLWFDVAALSVAGLIGLYVAWSYRDAVAAAVQHRTPRLAAFLRRS